MKTQPIEPARIDVDALLHAHGGALARAHQLFLRGNSLPERWAHCADFTVLDCSFGIGHNFLATWNAWRSDPARGARLHYVAIGRRAPSRDELARVHRGSPLGALAAQLSSAWPPSTPNLHPLAFDEGRVRLLLGWGDTTTLLREATLQADAVYLDNVNLDVDVDAIATDRLPQRRPRDLIAALARCVRIGARATIAPAARPLRDALRAAGFELASVAAPALRDLPDATDATEATEATEATDATDATDATAATDAPDTAPDSHRITQARYAPSFTPRRAPQHRAARAARQHALVVGGGLAGAALARSLSGLGWTCTVFDRHALPAQEASGNPAALFHGAVHADDGPHARFNRAAALFASRALQSAFAAGVPGQAQGLLRLAGSDTDLATMRALLARQRLPPQWLQALDADAAGERAGLPLAGPAWCFADGGWADPGALVRHWLATPGIEWRGGVEVQRLVESDAGWALVDAAGRKLAEAAVVAVASAADAPRLLAPWGAALPALRRTRGQISWWPQAPAGAVLPRCPLAGDGYALALPGGGLLCGASSTADDDDPLPRAADHAHNLVRLARLTGSAPAAETPPPLGRVGWRVGTDDRLPVAGAMPAAPVAQGAQEARHDQVRFVPRRQGLFVLTALGSRGLSWAPLLGELIAAQIAGSPLPLEADLQAAIDPARALVRAARHGR